MSAGFSETGGGIGAFPNPSIRFLSSLPRAFVAASPSSESLPWGMAASMDSALLFLAQLQI
eukprot:CAMPEP_0117574142 /NCGR_PEP_ID=MMETSP0784-20121206/61397_1 /TAXON_ID=39447 /ORGANISM="" /LENGTH=60 /DNA_ID=CAMNT_0005372889 /DNA_START=21 /DNA_END=200 /DNA_ORIENTATION=-